MRPRYVSATFRVRPVATEGIEPLRAAHQCAAQADHRDLRVPGDSLRVLDRPAALLVQNTVDERVVHKAPLCGCG